MGRGARVAHGRPAGCEPVTEVAGQDIRPATAADANHGNSYLVWQNSTTINIYETIGNTLYNRANAGLVAANGQTYQYRVTYNSGTITVWRNGAQVLSWTDSTPLTSGSFVAWRTNQSNVSFNNLRVAGNPASYNTLVYLHGDHLGSIGAVTNSSGALLDMTRFLPFGGFRGSDPAFLTERAFTGHKANNTSSNDLGLIYMGARFYVPSIGRFASADTIVPDPTNPQSYNRYSYVLNRVLNFTDPTGHRECGAFEGCSGEALPDIQKPALPTHSNHEPIPRNEYSEVELIFITLGVFAESSMGQHSPQAQFMKAWVWFNRVSPGKVFSNIDSSNPAGCPDNCAAWAGIVNDFLPNDITYAQASPEQRRIALINAYSCYMSSGCSKWGTNFNSTKALVGLAYTNYINGALDPTDGSTQFSHQSNLWRNNRLLANGSELYDYLVQNFYSYSQKNPDFRYSISKPFPFPFPGGEQKVILVTGNHNCVHFGSCK